VTINLRKLGQTDIEISPIGLGVMQFAGGKGAIRAAYSGITQEGMNAIVKTALDGGISWFDTAEMYGRGLSEHRLAQALQANAIKDEAVFVATKWWPMLRTARNIPRTIEQRQRYLSPYKIGLYQVHQPISFSSPEAEMNAMADLVERGVIRSVGVSNFDANRMRRAQAALQKRGLTLASNQVRYSLLYREIETNGIMETAKELGVTIIAWGPLNSGLLSGKFHKDPGGLENRPIYRRRQLQRKLDESRELIQVLDEIAADLDVTPAQVALNWLVNFHGDTVVAIPGATKPRHAAQNAGVMKFQLTDADLARIDDVSRKFR
jgi:aryl-alcohol dehydrogenase-like predicted oxidoreductase